MPSRQWWQMVAAVMLGMTLATVLRYVFIKSLTVLTLFGLGLLLAYLLDPLLDRLEKRGWSRGWAVATVMSGFLLLLILVGLLVVPQVVAQAQDAAANYGVYSAKAQASYEAWRGRIEAYADRRLPGVEVMPFLDAKVTEASEWLQTRLPAFLQWVSQQLLTSLSLLGMGALLLLITFNLLLVIDPFRRGLREMLPRSADAEVNRVSHEINRMLAQYLRGVVIISISVGVTAWLALTVLDVYFGCKYSLIVGLVTGLTYMVPYLGPVLSAASAGFVGYVTANEGSGLVAALASVLAMLLINLVFDNVVTPRIVGRRVGLHPLVVLFAAMMGLSLFGIWGMIIATPMAAVIKIMLARWLPVQGPDVTVKAPNARLDLDLWAGLKVAGAHLGRLRQNIEKAMGGNETPRPTEDAAPEHPAADTQRATDETTDRADDGGRP